MSFAARLEALRFALQVRTPGTTPDQTLQVAQTYLDWLEPPVKQAAPAQSGQPLRR